MYINIHTHLDKVADNVLTVKNIFPGRLKEELPSDCFISVGLHPWYINSRNPESGLSVIAEYASHPEVIAIGETGLDKFRGPSPEIQEEVFLHHHDISQSVRKPLIIHCVRSYTDIIALRKKLKPSVPWIIHGFNSSLQTAMQLIRNDCLLSFGPA
ncbi:MAG: TatD family hydrolase, partial [Bacteroidetes bacterium]|nr:TatD family hydrolase [Bacteroidota bacterium]